MLDRFLNFFTTHPRVALFVVLFCGIILRISQLNLPVSYDEAYTYIAFSRQNWLGILSDYSLPNNHILNSLLIKLSTALLGNHPWTLRIPALLAGLASILLAYLFGKRMFGVNMGLLACVLVAWLPAIIYYDTAARGYSLVTFFSLLAWFLGWMALKKGQWRYWLGISASIALGFLAVPTMALPAGSIYLWMLGELILRKEKQISAYLRWFISGCVSGIMIVILYTPALIFTGWRKLLANNFVQPVEPSAYFSRVLWRHLSGIWDLWNQDTPLTLALILVLGMLLSLFFFRKNSITRLHLAIPMFLWFAVFIILRRPNVYDRFWSFLLVPAMFWAAIGLNSITQRIRLGKYGMNQALVTISVLALIGFTLASLPTMPENWSKMSNIEAMAIELQAELQESDMVLSGYPHAPPLWYYLSRLGVDDFSWKAQTDFERAFVLTSIRYEQTPEKIIRENKLDLNLFDLENAVKLGRKGNLELYLIYPASSK
jgi:4-amino-4-deoxy-L-arabinose transferase-like glycosyltransferase